MLDIEAYDPQGDLEKAAWIFHHSGFVVVPEALGPEPLATMQAAAARIMQEQTEADPARKGNRGHHRYSFGSQLRHPEWCMLIDLPTILPVLEAIWGESRPLWFDGRFTCFDAGGDYSLPGAEIQPLHCDLGDFLHDPLGQITFQDLPTPVIVVNFPMVDFTRENGAIRFIPGTQRSKRPIPSLKEEPQWMKESILCVPAGSAVVRDIRCWHAGTPNTSDRIRPMTSVGYGAPWCRANEGHLIPRALYQTLSDTARELCRHIVGD